MATRLEEIEGDLQKKLDKEHPKVVAELIRTLNAEAEVKIICFTGSDPEIYGCDFQKESHRLEQMKRQIQSMRSKYLGYSTPLGNSHRNFGIDSSSEREKLKHIRSHHDNLLARIPFQEDVVKKLEPCAQCKCCMEKAKEITVRLQDDSTKSRELLGELFNIIGI